VGHVRSVLQARSHVKPEPQNVFVGARESWVSTSISLPTSMALAFVTLQGPSVIFIPLYRAARSERQACQPKVPDRSLNKSPANRGGSLLLACLLKLASAIPPPHADQTGRPHRRFGTNSRCVRAVATTTSPAAHWAQAHSSELPAFLACQRLMRNRMATITGWNGTFTCHARQSPALIRHLPLPQG